MANASQDPQVHSQAAAGPAGDIPPASPAQDGEVLRGKRVPSAADTVRVRHIGSMTVSESALLATMVPDADSYRAEQETLSISPAATGTWDYHLVLKDGQVCTLTVIHAGVDHTDTLDFEYIGNIGVEAMIAVGGFIDPLTWCDPDASFYGELQRTRTAAIDKGCCCIVLAADMAPVQVARNAEGVVVAASIGILECGGMADEAWEGDEGDDPRGPAEQGPIKQRVRRLIRRSLGFP